MGEKESFQDFKTKFLQLANGGRIPASERFDDLYEKLTTALQGQLLNQRHDMDKDFGKLCLKAGRIDIDLKRLNIRRNKEREARTAPPMRVRQPTTAPPMATPTQNPFVKTVNSGFHLLQRPAADTPKTPSDTRMTCFNCRKAGHMMADCPELKRATVKDIEEDEVIEFEQVVEIDDQGNDDA
jgi:hypothetical protein